MYHAWIRTMSRDHHSPVLPLHHRYIGVLDEIRTHSHSFTGRGAYHYTTNTIVCLWVESNHRVIYKSNRRSTIEHQRQGAPTRNPT